jgi:hypothetical protein
MSFWDSKDHLTCYYCKLQHKNVEAGGMWHCPNPLCTGPGAATWRSKCKSYREFPNETHTVDPEELIQLAMTMMETEADEVLRSHVLDSVKIWRRDREHTEVVTTATGVRLVVDQDD